MIRDHVGSTPLSNLTATLTQDMERIWTSLSKPPHLADVTLHQYFDLSFAALPHKVLMPDKFEDSVLELRKRFTDRSRDDYVFQPAYHKRIPADGVGFYMEGIWQQVLTNKDLDLPTQQELLAQFRCDEIAAAAIELFLSSAKVVRRPVEGGTVVEGLGALMKDWLETALGEWCIKMMGQYPLTIQANSIVTHRDTMPTCISGKGRTSSPHCTPLSRPSSLAS